MSTFDLALFQLDSSGKPTIAQLAGPVLGGRAVTAEEKLAQRFLLVLMTQLGSIKYDPTRGTTFPQALVESHFLSELDAFAAFGAGAIQAGVIMLNDENASMPNNERFGSAAVNQVTITPAAVQLSITVTSLAGTSAGISLPFVAGPTPPPE
jgi:hypothetical protein